MRKVFSLIALLLSVSIFTPTVSADDAKVKKVVGGLLNVISGATSGASTSTTSTATGAKSNMRRPDDGKLKATFDKDGIVTKIKSCTANDIGDVVIVFTLENQTNKDYRCRLLSEQTDVYDDEGNIYKGNNIISFAVANGEYNMYNCEVEIPAGMLLKYRIKIKDVDPAASMLKMVKSETYNGLDPRNHLVFKNVPITREGD